MLSLLRLVSLRHFVGSPLRSALTVLGVALGVATLVGITSINRSVMDAFRSTIDTIAGKAQLTVAADVTGFPEELLESVRGVPGVTHAAGTLTYTAAVKDRADESLFLIGVDLLDDGYFRTYESSDTDMSKLADDLEFLNSTDRLMLSERYAREHGLKPGSTLTLVTPDGAKDFVVHGLLKDTGPVKAFGGSVGVMFFGSLQEAFGRGRRFDRIDVAVDPKVGLETVRDRLRKLVGPSIEVDSPDRRGQSVETMVRSFQLGLNLGSAVALLVGVFLVYNTVSIGVVQRRREIGTLRALGATKRRIRTLFTLEAAVLGTVGSLLGLPLGITIGRGAMDQVSHSVSELFVRVNVKDVKLGTQEIVLGLAVGIAFSMFAALRPAWAASGVQPVEALRRDVTVGSGAVQLRSWPTVVGLLLVVVAYPVSLVPPPIENLPISGYLAVFLVLMGITLLSPLLLRAMNVPFRAPGQALFGIAGRLAADNFARSPLRTAVPVSALTIGVSMAIAIAGFVSSFQASTEHWLDQSVPADLFVTSSSKVAGKQNQPMSRSISAELATVPGIDVADGVRILPYDILGLRVSLIALSTAVYEAHAKPQIVEGRMPTPEEREAGYVLVSDNLARKRNLKVGDTFPVNTPTGQHPYKVGAIVVDYTSDQGSIAIERSIFDRQFQDDRVDTFHVYLKPGANLDEVRRTITEKLGKRFDLYVLSNAELRQEAHDMLGSAFSITYALEVVAVVLALLGVINTLLAAVLDRTREIGLLRAVGAARSHIIQLFAAEAAFIGLTGGLLGVLVGGLVGAIVTRVVGVQSTGWEFPFLYPWTTAVQMLVVASVCALLAGLYPARRAARLDVVEALSYE